MNDLQIKEFSYHIGWRTRGSHAGRHASTQRGVGMEFSGHTTLLSYPDPRRIDIRQTIRDPLEQVYVRIFNQKSATPIFMINDLSGSMNFGSKHRKVALSAQIMKSVAMSATHNSDSFGYIGFDDVVREDWHCNPSYRAHYALEMAEKLTEYHPEHVGSKGLADVTRYLPRERSLIFLVSDFHMPLEELESALSMMLRHHIVPVVLWDSTEYKNLPDFGIASLSDCETGARRTLLLRKPLRDRIVQNFEERRQAIHSLFMRFDMPPFFVENEFDADSLTEYFHQFVAT